MIDVEGAAVLTTQSLTFNNYDIRDGDRQAINSSIFSNRAGKSTDFSFRKAVAQCADE